MVCTDTLMCTILYVRVSTMYRTKPTNSPPSERKEKTPYGKTRDSLHISKRVSKINRKNYTPITVMHITKIHVIKLNNP